MICDYTDNLGAGKTPDRFGQEPPAISIGIGRLTAFSLRYSRDWHKNCLTDRKHPPLGCEVAAQDSG